jgi:uncharacterized membrane protein
MNRLSMMVMLFLVSGCGGGGEEAEEKPPNIDCSQVTPPSYAEVAQFQAMASATDAPKCTLCHSSTATGAARQEAPTTVNFDTYDAAKSAALQAAIEVNVGAMPPVDAHYSLTDTERTQIFNWTMCGTPP